MNKKILLLTFFTFILICLFPIISNASSSDLYLNNLKFDVKINDDGSMNVKEIWNINIESTNTLFKTFKTDNTKYSGITDVKVTDITNNTNFEFTKIGTYMYHVTKNCYYGLKNSDGDFEIAWGVGLDNSSATRKYSIEYKVIDAVTKYNDYAQLYWQFVGDEFEINAKKVEGTIILPQEVKNKENIKVWGHIKDLNGTIYATDLNKVEFQVNDYESKTYLEIRTLFPSYMIYNTKRVNTSNILDEAISEETLWAKEANEQREKEEKLYKACIIAIIVISFILAFVYIKKIIKYRKILKELKKYEPTNKLKYFRDLPDKNSTPGEAVFLLKNLYNDFNIDFGNIFSATLLNLTLKKYIEINVDKNQKGKHAITIKVLTKENYSNLPKDEKEILDFLIKSAENNNLNDTISINDLENYIMKKPDWIESLKTNTHKSVKTNIIQKGYFKEEEYNNYSKYIGFFALYLICAILFILLAPTSIVLIINAIYCYKIAKRINILTQTGVEQKEMWKGLKKYMEDFSMLDKREVPELVLWEKYLVYATAFGIADKVLKQLKMIYPNIEELNTSSYMYFMYNSNFNTNFSNAISNSIASSTYSSGSGSGGGFSGGGGFGRRWPVEVEVDNSNIVYLKI